jgi:hypothetical protein
LSFVFFHVITLRLDTHLHRLIVPSNVFSTLNITSVTELSLSGNQPLANVHRLQWNIAADGQLLPSAPADAMLSESGPIVVLTAMSIRTFEITFVRK